MKRILSFLIIILLFPLTVYAADGINLKVDKTDLEAGDEVTVSASLPHDQKVYALIATLSYDEKIFEKIDDNSFSVKDNTVDVTYNKNNNKFGIINQSGEVEDELFKVRLKVKEDCNVGNTNIALTNISSSSGDKKTTYPMVSTKVFVSRDAKENEEIPNYKENTIEEEKEKVIKTFTTSPAIFVLSVLSIIFIITALYHVVKKHDGKKGIFLTVLAIISLVISVSLFIMNWNKKDVNNDGEKNYDDAKEIIKYLIDIKGTEEEKEEKEEVNEDSNIEPLSNQSTNNNNNSSSNNNNNVTFIPNGGLPTNGANNPENNNTNNNETTNNDKPNNDKPNNDKPNSDYDVNNDGKVDIDDVGGSTQDTTENTDYKITLTEKDGEPIYVNKGNITLNFIATIKPLGHTIKEVKINNKLYPVLLNGDYYMVTLEETKSGVHNYKISSVILDNKKEVKTNLTIKKEVLKENPYVNLFNLDDENNILTFNLEDVDSSVKESEIIIYDDNDKELIRKKVEKENSLHYDFLEDKIYSIRVIATYDLDSNQLNKQTGRDDNLHINEEIFTHKFIIGGDYNFQVSDVLITDALQKNEKPKITFTSSNARRYPLEYIVLSGKQYKVATLGNGKYEVVLENFNTANTGSYELSVDRIVLDNLKAFINKKDFDLNPLKFYVLKNAPTIEDISLKEDKENKEIIASYNLKDADQTLEKLTAVLVDSSDNIVTTKEISKEQINKPVNISYASSVDGMYKVKFLADYNLGVDQYSYTDKNIGEESILTQKDIYISKIEVVNKYPTKKQKQYQIVYEVFVGDKVKQYAKDNHGNRVYNTVSVVTINGLNYNAVKTGNTDFTSRITLNVPDESGLLNLTASRVQLQYEDYNVTFRDYYSIKPETIQIDVLKDKPRIENLVVKEENYETGSVTFDFDVVVDKGGYKNGYIVLNDEKQEINEGKNSVTFNNIEKDKTSKLSFIASYDLDTNKLEEEENKNEFNDQVIHEVNYGLYSKNVYDSIKIENIKALSSNKNKYFEKNEEIVVSFNINGIKEELGLEPTKVVIKDKEYLLTKNDNGYSITLDGYSSFGEKEIKITDVYMNNGKKVTLKNAADTKLVVLKDVISITDYKYEILNDLIKVNTILKDYDGSLVDNALVKIVNEDGKVIKELPYEEEFTFNKDANNLRYYIEIYGDYDRDIDIKDGSDNYHKNVKLLDEVVSLEVNKIELKNIADLDLYFQTKENGNDKIIHKEEVEVSDLKNNLSSYFVEIKMDNLPTIRCRIKEILRENNHLMLVIDYESSPGNKETIKLDYGPIDENDKSINTFHSNVAFANILEEIKENNEKEITLTRDYDAKEINSDALTYIEETFKGKINGNGHTIRNLSKPLFKEIDGGTIENLILENVTLSNRLDQGSLANQVSNTTIKNVLVNGINKTISGVSRNGGLVGLATNNSEIINCGVKDATLTYNNNVQQSGGLVGYLSNSKITNSYAIGNINANWNYIGGLIGNSANSEVTNSYNKVALSGHLVCDFACSAEGRNNIFKNNLSLSTGGKNGFAGNYKEFTNNYKLVDEKTESTVEGLTNITKEEVTEDLFINKLHYDKNIWTLSKISLDNTPTFNYEKTEFEKLNDYDANSKLLYANLSKLMPFYDDQKIISIAKTIPNTSKLKTEEIMHLVPVDSSGNIVTYLTNKNPKKISKIKIVYETGEKEEYNVRYDNSYNNVAIYRISDLKIDYTYNHYIIDENSNIINNLTNYILSLSYEDNLDKLTSTIDSRIYRDFYNETTRNEAKEFVLKYLSNSNYTNTTNDAINSYLETEIKKDQKLEKVLYVYNYLRRFYHLEIDGMMLNDFILFNFQGFDSSLTPLEIANLYLKDGNNFATNATSDKFNNVFGKYTNMNNIETFLEYMVTKFSNNNMNDWIKKQYKGLLTEIPVEGHSEVQYTLWDHFKNKDIRGWSWSNYLLPILSLPEYSSYIISSPVQFIIGAQRTYLTDPTSPTEQARLKRKINSYTERMKDYYDTAYNIIKDPKVFNDIHTIQIDKRYAYDDNGVLTFQSPYATEEPFHKNFNEVLGIWAYNDYNAATANGAQIIWRVEGLMDGNLSIEDGIVQEYTFHTWSHESAHNVDARLFLRDYSRRFDAGGEDYADSNLTQAFGVGDIVMNLSSHYEPGSKIGSNLEPSRIDTPEKIKDFYNKLFQTVYIMDYIEGMAFLQLTPEQQSKIAVQVFYPNENKYTDELSNYLQYKTTVYHEIDENEYKNMTLNSINDLYDNKLVIFPGVIYSTYGANRYGGENIFKAHWYQPHNDYGRPDSYSIKWLAYEMLGYAGYDEGYIEYYSNINSIKKDIYDNPDADNKKIVIADYKTDKMAIQKITNYNSVDEYKKARFKEVEDHLEYINNCINVNEYFNEFYEALVKDAEAVKQKQEEAKKAYPLDTEEAINSRNQYIINSKVKNFANRQAVREKLYYTLKNTTNDFRGDVYLKTKQQDISEFKINKNE